MNTSQPLAGDVAIVTGAGRNIGRAIAERFAAEGAHVAVADVSEGRARSVADGIREAGREAVPVVADVTDEGDVRALVDETEDAFGPISVLVNNAAVMDRGAFDDLSVEAFDRVLTVNLRGPFLCTQEAARSMRRAGGGRIVNLSSSAAHRAPPTSVAYNTTKSGILCFTRSVAKALADDDIRVNALTPAYTGWKTFEPDKVDPNAASDEERTDGPGDTEAPPGMLIGRYGTPEEIAAAALFLISPENSLMTGAELRVDGGRSA